MGVKYGCDFGLASCIQSEHAIRLCHHCRPSGGSGGQWRQAARGQQHTQQQQQVSSSVVQTTDSSLADAYGGGNWGSNSKYNK